MLDKARLEGTPLARLDNPSDPLRLDIRFDKQQMAEHLALVWFKPAYDLGCHKLGWSTSNINPDWFIPLVKRYHLLKSVGQMGATAVQLVRWSSTQSGHKDTRDIFIGESFNISDTAITNYLSLLALPFRVSSNMRETLGLSDPVVRAQGKKGKGKGKAKARLEPDSDSEEPLDNLSHNDLWKGKGPGRIQLEPELGNFASEESGIETGGEEDQLPNLGEDGQEPELPVKAGAKRRRDDELDSTLTQESCE
jgi:hypothetical protein